MRLTPDQLADLDDGWHTAIVLGPFDLDTLHTALTYPGVNQQVGGTHALSERIQSQIRQQHALARVGRKIDDIFREPTL